MSGIDRDLMGIRIPKRESLSTAERNVFGAEMKMSMCRMSSGFFRDWCCCEADFIRFPVIFCCFAICAQVDKFPNFIFHSWEEQTFVNTSRFSLMPRCARLWVFSIKSFSSSDVVTSCRKSCEITIFKFLLRPKKIKLLEFWGAELLDRKCNSFFCNPSEFEKYSKWSLCWNLISLKWFWVL